MTDADVAIMVAGMIKPDPLDNREDKRGTDYHRHQYFHIFSKCFKSCFAPAYATDPESGGKGREAEGMRETAREGAKETEFGRL